MFDHTLKIIVGKIEFINTLASPCFNIAKNTQDISNICFDSCKGSIHNKMQYKIFLDMIKNGLVQLEEIPLEYRSEELILSAIENNWQALKHVPVQDQTEQMCLSAVKQNWQALKYAEFQTVEICKIAVEQNGLALEFANVQNENICMIAFKKDFYETRKFAVFTTMSVHPRNTIVVKILCRKNPADGCLCHSDKPNSINCETESDVRDIMLTKKKQCGLY